MLQIADLRYRIAGRPILDGAGLALARGRRAALVGRNGAGKTTLLRLIAGELEPDSGSIALARGARAALVAQTAPSGAQSPRELVLAADPEPARLAAEAAAAERAGDGAAAGAAHARLGELGAHAAPARAAAILHGLGFSPSALDAPLDALSGGWRMRAALAAALFAEPDLLLLDEPTNHLDLEAGLWLAAFLARWPRALILCSHERALVDRVAHETVHLERGRAKRYRGGFAAFMRARGEQAARDAALRKRAEADRRHMQGYIDRFRYKATKARQAQSRLKALERMNAPPPPLADRPPPRIRFPDPPPLPPPLLRLEGAAAGYPGAAPVLSGLDLRIDMDDRIALLGPNGNGKTTLLRLLAGRLAPLAGAVRASPRLATGYYAQDRADALDPALSADEHVAARWPDAGETIRRAHCARFGLEGERAARPAATLSGGEAARLALALVCCAKPQLLLLDEPVNHLDMDAREAFLAALNEWSGAVVLVAHDRAFVERAADRLWLVADGACRPFDADLEEYERLVLRRRAGDAPRSRETGRTNRAGKPGAADAAAPRGRDAGRGFRTGGRRIWVIAGDRHCTIVAFRARPGGPAARGGNGRFSIEPHVRYRRHRRTQPGPPGRPDPGESHGRDPASPGPRPARPARQAGGGSGHAAAVGHRRPQRPAAVLERGRFDPPRRQRRIQSSSRH